MLYWIISPVLIVQFSVLQPAPQSNFRTFASPHKKALSILTSSLRQPLIYFFYFFEAWHNVDLLLPVLQVRNPGMEGLTEFSALGLRKLKSWCQLLPGGSGGESSIHLISVVHRIHFRGAVYGLHFLADCQQGPLSVLKRQPHSSCGSSIFKASKSPLSPQNARWNSDFFFCHGPGKNSQILKGSCD